MKNKAIAAIALQMILWHQTTNGGTMLHHGMGEGKISDHGQQQNIHLFETDQITPEAITEFKFQLEAQEQTTSSGDILKLHFEAERNNSTSSGVSDGNYPPTDPRYGDYDPYDPGLDPD